jgi:C-terminal processing protease CtpA/Prc
LAARPDCGKIDFTASASPGTRVANGNRLHLNLKGICMTLRTPSHTRTRHRASAILISLLVIHSAALSARAQLPLSSSRDSGRIMLSVLKSDLEKNYYDPTFHGVDLNARFKQADEEIKRAASVPEILRVISDALMSLDDSHTFFVPPGFTDRIEHGWAMEMIGDKCYVSAVQPGSDAESKGLRAGDRIVSIEGVLPTRRDLWKLEYTIFVLAPRYSLHVAVEKPDGTRATYETRAEVHKGKPIIHLDGGMASDLNDLIRNTETDLRLNAHRIEDIGKETLIWKMPNFELSELQFNELLDRVHNRKSLILDLRGNHGGDEQTLLKIIGAFFDHDVKVGDLKRRKESKPLVAKTRGGKAFAGKLAVLVDSESGSAAEVLARVVQLEKRGMIVGDRTAGAVMRGRSLDHQLGDTLAIYYGASVSDADLLFSDGRSLERTGVMPDEIVLPRAVDLASQRDPALARAGQLVGLDLSPERAGAMFPVMWRK